MNDLKFALRALRKSPGFALIAVFILAVGIGGTTAIFSAVRAVLLRPLAFPEPNQLVRAFSVTRGHRSTVSPPDFSDWRTQSPTFTGLAAMNSGAFALTGEGPAEQIPGASVTGDFFGVMEVAPLLGRSLGMADAQSGAPRVVVLGYRLWQRRFGGDSSVIGKSVQFEAQPYTVVGVMPAGFTYPDGADVWLPLSFTADDLATQRGAHYLDVIGRLKPGVTLERAEGELRQVAARLASAYPNTNPEGSADVLLLREAMVGAVRPAMQVLFGAVALVLLIACTNVASLTLVRGLGREHEFAIRTALGADRLRMARALLVESLALAAVGGGAGLVLATWLSHLISQVRSAGIPLLDQTTLDGPVLAFAAGATLLTGLLFGMFPAWQAASLAGLSQKLKEEGRGTSGGRARLRTRNTMVVVQTALAVLLLAGAGVLMRSFVRLRAVDPGFDPNGVLTFGVSLPDAAYGESTARADFGRRLIERLEALPGVDAAGAVFGLPLTGFRFGISGWELDGRQLDNEEQDRLDVQVRVVTPDYFRSMGIAVRRGRGIESTDRKGTTPVMVINESAAKLLWPGADPLGHHFTIGARLGEANRAGGEVVGVIGDIREDGIARPASPTIFFAHAQVSEGYLGVAVRTSGDPTALVASARAALADVDPNVPMFQVRTMRQLLDDAVGQPRLYMLLVGAFAVVALVLAATGLYGILAQGVAQRTREIGVRVALGAERRDIVRMVLRQAVTLATVGVAAGLTAALFATGVLRGLLYGVGPNDPATLGAVIGTLAVVTLFAAILPARRAARVEPMEALRHE
jgi:putative ABC transport system permease protein